MIKLLMYDATTITHEISTTYFCAIPTKHTIETKQNKKTNVPRLTAVI